MISTTILTHVATPGTSDSAFNVDIVCLVNRDAPITHWPIIGRPIIGAKQSADYRLIQKVPETGQKPTVHTV